jgi:hypothetical protein
MFLFFLDATCKRANKNQVNVPVPAQVHQQYLSEAFYLNSYG